ncbi:MAG: DUF523 domain-containing protein [Actinomycetota bacterium]|nr:DUF523 domain-containing protein [Actinomycetota bacterium]MDQ3640870.1 DUF523 domain-containing protein [Actinomycetota bacterium]
MTRPDAESDHSVEPTIVVSACLLGVRCNHLGAASPSQAVAELASHHHLAPICPEVAGGLPTPRPAAEIQADGSVRTREGHDVSDAYRRGAEATVALARAVGASQAVLKARSPSCGCHEVYDGTFTRTRVAGEGITARALREAGLRVRSEEDIADPGRP